MKARNLALAALFVGPAAAMIDLTLSYYLVYPAQGSGHKTGLHIVTVLALLVTVVGIVMSRRALARDSETAPVDRFLALGGLALNAFFLLVIVGFAIPKLVLGIYD